MSYLTGKVEPQDSLARKRYAELTSKRLLMVIKAENGL
jgi:hypothetical protein